MILTKNIFEIQFCLLLLFIYFRVKQRLHETLQIDREFTEEDFEKVSIFSFQCN